MRGLSYEELAAAYELRHGFERPTPWKRIAREYGVTVHALCNALRRLELGGLNRNANGEKPLSRVTEISDQHLNQIDALRDQGKSWPVIAGILDLPVGTVKSRHWRWSAAHKKAHPRMG